MDQAAGWGLTPEQGAAWGQGHKNMMRATTAALAPNGVLLGKDAWEVGDYVNGALHEGCAAENATILTLQNLTARAEASGARLIYQCHGTGKEDEMAAFLIGAGEYHFYGMGGWSSSRRAETFAGHRSPLFDKQLGAPAGPGQYDSVGQTWTRRFASGTRVTFNATSKKGSIAWAS